MSPEEKKTSIVWRIKAIDLLAFKVEPNLKGQEQYDTDKISFSLSSEVNTDSTTTQINVVFEARVFADETHKEELGSIQTRGEYLIKNYEEVVSQNNGQFPIAVVAGLLGVTLSTTRGMLLLLSKGTVFEKAIIPIIDPQIFFQKKTSESSQ